MATTFCSKNRARISIIMTEDTAQYAIRAATILFALMLTVSVARDRDNSVKSLEVGLAVFTVAFGVADVVALRLSKTRTLNDPRLSTILIYMQVILLTGRIAAAGLLLGVAIAIGRLLYAVVLICLVLPYILDVSIYVYEKVREVKANPLPRQSEEADDVETVNGEFEI